MSFPKIPNITPDISIDKNQCLSMLVASVALEEMGLSHIINSEAEKIQYVLGTLNEQKLPEPATIDQLLEINNSVAKTFRGAIMNQMQLCLKLDDIIRLYGWNIYLNIATVTAQFGGMILSASDQAYYHTKGGAV